MQGMYQMLLAVVLLFAAGAHTVSARDDFIEVTHQDLLEYPQKYWSQGIIFKDVLIGLPKGRSIKLGEKEYIPFKTKNLGTCYVGRDVISSIKEDGLNKEIIFQGTVLHQPSSFFSRTPSFYVVVQRLTPAVDGVELAQQELFKASDAGRFPASSELVGRIQQDLINYARQNNLSLAEVFSDKETRAKAANLVYSSIAALEQQEGVTARKILGDFVMEVFVAEYGNDGVRLPAHRAQKKSLAPDQVPAAASAQEISVEPRETKPVAQKPKQAASPRVEVDESASEESVSAEQQRIAKLRERVALLLKPGVGMKAPLQNEAPAVKNTKPQHAPKAPAAKKKPADTVKEKAGGAAGHAETEDAQDEDPLADLFPDETAGEEEDAKVFRQTPQN